jgi:predicted DNA-binding protein (UPF0251 family)
MSEPELIPLNEAARRLEVSKMTMARLVREGRFTVYENPLDRRQKLVDAREVAAAVQPRMIRPAEPLKKAAA